MTTFSLHLNKQNKSDIQNSLILYRLINSCNLWAIEYIITLLMWLTQTKSFDLIALVQKNVHRQSSRSNLYLYSCGTTTECLKNGMCKWLWHSMICSGLSSYFYQELTDLNLSLNLYEKGTLCLFKVIAIFTFTDDNWPPHPCRQGWLQNM